MVDPTRADDISGRVSPVLSVFRSNHGIEKPFGAREAVTEPVTAPTVDWDGFDKAIADAVVLHVPVAFG